MNRVYAAMSALAHLRTEICIESESWRWSKDVLHNYT